MTIESAKFTFSDVERFYHQSGEISRTAKPPIKGGVRAVTVACKGCGRSWRAGQSGEGQLVCAIGTIFFTCPFCNADEQVSVTVFDQKS